jgi:hypothetical protein
LGLLILSSLSLNFGCQMDRFTNPKVGTAAAKITGHGGINVFVCWVFIFPKQYSRGHDLARLTIATLRDIQFHPGFL